MRVWVPVARASPAGLHIGPLADDVLTGVSPGAEKLYTYDILPEHMMGTHWCVAAPRVGALRHVLSCVHSSPCTRRYHAHRHGATALQVSGGLHGLLIMDPSDADLAALPLDIAALYDSTNNAYYYEMVLAHLFFGDGDPLWGDMHEYSYQELWDLYPNQTVDPHGTIYTSTPNFFVINGQYQPEVEVSEGSVALLRMVNTGGYRQLVLKVSQPTVCTMRLIARDGIFQQNGYPQVTRMAFWPGTRLDIAVQCNPGPTATYPVDVTVYADTVDIGPMTGNMHAQDCVFKFRVVSAANSQQNPMIAFFPTGEVTYPSYMPNLMNTPGVWSKLVDLDSWAINTQYFWGVTTPLQYVPLQSCPCVL